MIIIKAILVILQLALLVIEICYFVERNVEMVLALTMLNVLLCIVILQI